MSRTQKLKGLSAASLGLKTFNDNPYLKFQSIWIGIHEESGETLANDKHCFYFCANSNCVLNKELLMKSTVETRKDIDIVKASFKKMMSDKKAVSAYIREKGTLKGFNGGSIQFAKPLWCLWGGEWLLLQHRFWKYLLRHIHKVSAHFRVLVRWYLYDEHWQGWWTESSEWRQKSSEKYYSLHHLEIFLVA